jgi:hypothetical protein
MPYQWTQVRVNYLGPDKSIVPCDRSYFGSCIDKTSNLLYIYGGIDCNSTVLNDMNVLDLSMLISDTVINNDTVTDDSKQHTIELTDEQKENFLSNGDDYEPDFSCLLDDFDEKESSSPLIIVDNMSSNNIKIPDIISAAPLPVFK